MQIDESAVDSADTNPRPEITMRSTIAKQKSYPRVKIERVIHAIHAVIDIAAGRAKYLDVLGGLIFAEGYFEPEDRDMALLYVADFMIEPMAPRHAAREDKPFA